MAIGGLTRQMLESQAVYLAEQLTRLNNQAEELRSRCATEAAAGTLDGTDFYPPSDPVATADRANLLGFLDDMHNVWATRQGYINHLIGVSV